MRVGLAARTPHRCRARLRWPSPVLPRGRAVLADNRRLQPEMSAARPVLHPASREACAGMALTVHRRRGRPPARRGCLRGRAAGLTGRGSRRPAPEAPGSESAACLPGCRCPRSIHIAGAEAARSGCRTSCRGADDDGRGPPWWPGSVRSVVAGAPRSGSRNRRRPGWPGWQRRCWSATCGGRGWG
ncbi:hypothetical protein D9M71_40140 [compost metagenome]